MIEPHRIAGQFFNRPLLLTPASARTISSFLLSRFEMRRGAGGDDDAGTTRQAFQGLAKPDGSVEYHSPRASRFIGDYRTGPDGRPTPYRVTADGTAIISIIGELVNRGAWVGASSGLVSYEGIRHQLSAAARDPQVSAILLDLESPGGEAVGAFETAALVRKVREEKPVIAMVNGMAASAGFAIPSGASRIISIPTGLAGSIGVVMMHLDVSEYLEAEGVKPTLIFAGAHKVDGNPYEPLPDAVRAKFQSEIDQFYSLFVQTVSAGRSAMTEQAIRATEAQIFMGDDAKRVGLVDEVATFDEVIAALAGPQSRPALLGRPFSSAGAKAHMTENTNAPKANATTAPEPAATAPGPTFAEATAGPPQAAAPAPAAPPTAPAAPPAPAAASGTISRAEAAELTAIAAQASRLGVNIDLAKALTDGVSADALRAQVLNQAAAQSEATTVVTASPTTPRVAGDKPKAREGSPLLDLAKASAGRSQ